MTSDTEIANEVAFARSISRWLGEAGVEKTEMAVDFADIVSAARRVEEALVKMLLLDVTNRMRLTRRWVRWVSSTRGCSTR